MLMYIFCGLVGAIIMGILIVIDIKIEELRDDRKEFVKKLIEKEGWDGANEILTFEFGGKYLNIWRKMYREYVKGEDNNE